MRRAGVALPTDMVADRRRRLAGHALRLPREHLASVAMDWVPEGLLLDLPSFIGSAQALKCYGTGLSIDLLSLSDP